MTKFFTILLAGTLLVLSHISLSYADIFIFIDGIAGESRDATHQGWIQVESATWGHGEAPPGSVVKVQFQRLAITKLNDSTSAILAQAAATGKPFKDVRLEMVRSGGDTQVVMNRVKLTGARVTNFQTAGHGSGSVQATDALSFSFESITWINFKIDPAGRQQPGSAGCYDLKTNTACPASF